VAKILWVVWVPGSKYFPLACGRMFSSFLQERVFLIVAEIKQHVSALVKEQVNATPSMGYGMHDGVGWLTAEQVRLGEITSCALKS
jgi:hypothetical protein